MSQYTSYYLYQKYEKRGNQNWFPVIPSVYSIDAEGTMPVSAKTEDDPACGYVPPVVAQYRWVNLPIETDYICDECSAPPTPEYRWVTVSGEYTCSGTTKMTKEKQQYSNDGGETWTDTGQYRTGSTVIAYDSTDCGYVPPTPTFKFKATYTGGSTYSAECDSNTTLTTATTKPSGYQYSAMTSAEIGDCVTSIGSSAFSDCSSLSSITIPDSVTIIGDVAFHKCSGLTSIVIPNSVTSIGDWAFNYCSGLTSIDIPDGVTSIGMSVFQECRGLTSIDIPDSVTSIGNGAFAYCISLTSIDIPDSVTSISYQAFVACTSLTSVTIGSGVTSIGTYAFQGCSSLTSITVEAATPPTLLNVNAFVNTNDCPIYVPSGSVNTYKNASGWSNYASRIQAIP